MVGEGVMMANRPLHSLKLTANAPEKRPKRTKRKRELFRLSIFRCELLVSGRVHIGEFWDPLRSPTLWYRQSHLF